MDKETKSFFEKLAGVSGIEYKPEAAPIKTNNQNSNSNGQKNSAPEKSENFEKEIFEEAEGQLGIDVYQTPSSFVIESTIAGVNPDDVDISITSDSVTVRGKREKDEKIRTEDYLYQECFWGKFSRSVILPQEIDPDRAQASLKNGVLRITLPKINKAKTKKLKVRFE